MTFWHFFFPVELIQISTRCGTKFHVLWTKTYLSSAKRIEKRNKRTTWTWKLSVPENSSFKTKPIPFFISLYLNFHWASYWQFKTTPSTVPHRLYHRVPTNGIVLFEIVNDRHLSTTIIMNKNTNCAAKIH